MDKKDTSGKNQPRNSEIMKVNAPTIHLGSVGSCSIPPPVIIPRADVTVKVNTAITNTKFGILLEDTQ